MRFHARALTADNRLAEVDLEATDESDARRELLRRHCHPIAIRPASQRAMLGDGSGARFPLTLFAQELLALLTAGLSLVETLEALAQKQPHAADEAIVRDLHAALHEGKRFSIAMQARSDVFPPLLVGLVQAAEGTSDLPAALRRYVDYRQRSDQIRQKLVSASIYPVILLVVGTSVAFFLFGYVVPRFASVYRGTGRQLPWLSQAMLDIGRWIGAHSGPVLAAVLVALAALAWTVWAAIRRGTWLDTLSRLPGVGARVQQLTLSRLYLTLGMLLQGGISIVPALQILIDSAAGGQRDALQRASARIRSGEPLSLAFEASSLATPISLRLLRVGEQTGDLGTMLARAAEFQEGDLSRFVERFSRAAEPLMMAAIGLVVGAIVVLLYMPIFDLAGSLR